MCLNTVCIVSQPIYTVGCSGEWCCWPLQKRCTTWADAGECDNNPGFMTNNCKVACKRCSPPAAKRASKKTVGKASSSSLTSQGAKTVQKGAAAASEAAGKVVNSGKEATSEAAGKVVNSGKEAVTSLVTNTTALMKNGTVQKGAAAASEAAGKVVSSGKEAVTSLVTNTTSLVKNATSGVPYITCHCCQ